MKRFVLMLMLMMGCSLLVQASGHTKYRYLIDGESKYLGMVQGKAFVTCHGNHIDLKNFPNPVFQDTDRQCPQGEIFKAMDSDDKAPDIDAKAEQEKQESAKERDAIDRMVKRARK
jgi:hypothetical protein